MYPGCSQCSGEAWCPDLVATRGCLLPLWDLASPFFFVVVRKQMGGVARALLLLPSWVNVERTQKTVPVWIGSDQSAAHMLQNANGLVRAVSVRRPAAAAGRRWTHCSSSGMTLVKWTSSPSSKVRETAASLPPKNAITRAGTQELQLIPRKCDFWVIADGEKISSSKRSGFACEIPRKD